MTLKEYFWRPPGILAIVTSVIFMEVFGLLQTAGYFTGVKAGSVYLISIPLILAVVPWLVIALLWRQSSTKPRLEATLFSLIGVMAFSYSIYRYMTL